MMHVRHRERGGRHGQRQEGRRWTGEEGGSGGGGRTWNCCTVARLQALTGTTAVRTICTEDLRARWREARSESIDHKASHMRLSHSLLKRTGLTRSAQNGDAARAHVFCAVPSPPLFPSLPSTPPSPSVRVRNTRSLQRATYTFSRRHRSGWCHCRRGREEGEAAEEATAEGGGRHSKHQRSEECTLICSTRSCHALADTIHAAVALTRPSSPLPSPPPHAE
jgi:hypothetical protein